MACCGKGRKSGRRTRGRSGRIMRTKRLNRPQTNDQRPENSK